MKEDLAWGGAHTIQYRDDVLQNYTPETYVVVLTSITPINSIKNKNILPEIK